MLSLPKPDGYGLMGKEGRQHKKLTFFFSTTRQEFTAKHKLIRTSSEQQPCILFQVCWVLQGRI